MIKLLYIALRFVLFGPGKKVAVSEPTVSEPPDAEIALEKFDMLAVERINGQTWISHRKTSGEIGDFSLQCSPEKHQELVTAFRNRKSDAATAD